MSFLMDVCLLSNLNFWGHFKPLLFILPSKTIVNRSFCSFCPMVLSRDEKCHNSSLQSALWIKQFWVFLHRSYLDMESVLTTSLDGPKTHLVAAKNEFYRKGKVLGKVRGIQERDRWGGKKEDTKILNRCE